MAASPAWHGLVQHGTTSSGGTRGSYGVMDKACNGPRQPTLHDSGWLGRDIIGNDSARGDNGVLTLSSSDGGVASIYIIT